MRCISLFQRWVDAVFDTGAINSTPELAQGRLARGLACLKLESLGVVLDGRLAAAGALFAALGSADLQPHSTVRRLMPARVPIACRCSV